MTETLEKQTEASLDRTESSQTLESVPSQSSLLAGVSQATFEQLTKKNQAYLLSVEKQLDDEVKETSTLKAVFNELATTLIQGQKTGQTAKHLYGTPTECAAIIKEQHFPKAAAVDNTPSSSKVIALDGALLLGSIYVIMTGLSLLTAKNPTINGIGLLTIIVNYISAGFAMLLIAKNLPNVHAEKGKKGYVKYFAMATLAMFIWVVAVSVTTAVTPVIINPLLPPVVLVVLGAITLTVRFILKKKLNIKGGIF